MKKFVLFLLCMLALSLPAMAADRVEVVVSGEILESDADAEIVNGRTFVPLRAIAEKLGADVDWDQDTQSITLTKNAAMTKLTIDSLEATVSGRNVGLEAAPYIKEGRTFVPLRFIAQGLGGRAIWCDDIRTAVIIPAYDKLEGPDGELLETYFSATLPAAIQADNEELAKDLLDAPEEIASYFANLWEDLAMEYLAKNITADDLEDYRALPNNNLRRYNFLKNVADEYGLSIECPIKMCAVENNGNVAVILDALAPRTASMVTQYVLQNINGTLVANPL
ncbi:MAG: copper amine oxidase N-terminal domain-containing protein [Oscillospiraceae bacterium]|nr:copper amine oxidase N-terminal domain-containing protein [Oscillospiraceae bacterium]